MERVQKRVLDKFLDNNTSPQTKRVAAKVHAQLAREWCSLHNGCWSLPGHPVLSGYFWCLHRECCIFWLQKSYLVHQYIYLVPLIPTMNKALFKSFDSINYQCYCMPYPIQIPVFVLLQTNFLHHLTDFIFDWTILWMVWWPRDDWKVAWSNTVCHRIVYVHAMMCREIIPNKNSI